MKIELKIRYTIEIPSEIVFSQKLNKNKQTKHSTNKQTKKSSTA